MLKKLDHAESESDQTFMIKSPVSVKSGDLNLVQSPNTDKRQGIATSFDFHKKMLSNKASNVRLTIDETSKSLIL